MLTLAAVSLEHLLKFEISTSNIFLFAFAQSIFHSASFMIPILRKSELNLQRNV